MTSQQNGIECVVRFEVFHSSSWGNQAFSYTHLAFQYSTKLSEFEICNLIAEGARLPTMGLR